MRPSRRMAASSGLAAILRDALRSPRGDRNAPQDEAGIFLAIGAVIGVDGSEHLVLLEPVGHLGPALLGGFLAVARPIVGMEAVRRARIDLEVGGLAGSGERGLHGLNLRDRDAAVGFAVETEPRRLHLGGKLRRA